MPSNTDRTILGVGEAVYLTTTNGLTWSKIGNGSLSSRTGSQTVYTAGPTAGEATVIVVGRKQSICTAASIIFTIITPTVAHYDTLQTFHHQGTDDIGFRMNIYATPNTVSFYNTWIQEAQAYYTATGVYGCYNGSAHEAGPVPVQGTMYVGVGTQFNATDRSFANYCPGDQFAGGSMSISIPTQYSVGSSGGPWYTVNAMNGATNATTAGDLSKSKDHVSWSTTVDSPTVGF